MLGRAILTLLRCATVTGLLLGGALIFPTGAAAEISILTDLNRLLSKGISGKQSNGRTLHVYHYSGDTLGEEGRNCHLIYFDELAAETFSKDIDETATLLISSPNNQHTDHSLIFLQIQNGKLVFFVNQKRLEASLLEFNAALLWLARRKL